MKRAKGSWQREIVRVHPRTGVGIETMNRKIYIVVLAVHPRTGVGIETGGC